MYDTMLKKYVTVSKYSFGQSFTISVSDNSEATCRAERRNFPLLFNSLWGKSHINFGENRTLVPTFWMWTATVQNSTPSLIVRLLYLLSSWKNLYVKWPLFFKTTCNIRPHFLCSLGGLKIEGLKYIHSKKNNLSGNI